MTTFRIKEILKERGLTARWLCDEIERVAGIVIDPVTLSAYTTDKQWPRREKLFAIARALDVDVRDLFNPTKEAQEKRETLFRRDENGNYIPAIEVIER